MRTSRKSTLSAVAAAALAVTVLTGVPAAASGHTILRDGFEGNIPPTQGGPVIGGVNSAGAPWVLKDSSRVRVREDGRITVVLRGLVIVDGRQPASAVLASLVCGGMGGTEEARTLPFPLNPRGNGHTSQRIDVPEDCDDPIVLIRNASAFPTVGGYFAFTTDADD
jgi:hypothetical protein